MSGKKQIAFKELKKKLSKRIKQIPEHRTGKNKKYEIKDAVLSAFAIFYMQSASFLGHQKLVEKRKGTNNLKKLFGATKIPSDEQIRNLIDPISPQKLEEVFADCVDLLADRGYLDEYRTFDKQLLCAIDGTRYFDSKTLNCINCSHRTETNETITYSHYAMLPVIANPKKKEVIALAPEFIRPQDGHKKQDCEINAAKRWMKKHGRRYSNWKMTLLGDDLYCHQPFCEEALGENFNFILVCKPDSHKVMYKWIEQIDKGGRIAEVEKEVRAGKRREIVKCRYINDIPIKGGDGALMVNWCEITITEKGTGKQLYYNSFATNHHLSSESVIPICEAGRSRWKVENEGNNVLKNRGYHLEHNFGHGKKHLAMNLLSLNLLAFLFHTILQLSNQKYQVLRDALGARYRFFNDLVSLTRYFVYKSWEHLLDFMLEGLEISLPPPK